MILTVIGSGTAAPEPHRVCSGYQLDVAGLSMLFDCGSGVVHNMARIGVDWGALSHLLLSHFHLDHIGDVPMLFFAWKHGMRPPRRSRLNVIGPRGTGRLLERLGRVLGSHITEPGFDVDVDELEDGDERQLNDVVRLRAVESGHTDGALAFRVDTPSRSFCYTGDTGMSERVARLAQNVDALLIECSLPDEEPMESHLTPTRVAAMARIALPRRLLLTHVYPQLDRARLPELVRLGGWPARVEVVADGDRLEI